ncbi:hypothetical protein FRAHR75_330029 [Frankia sp. Hr75.2]|nr:hypothetical protein FRAHR75_330029 [Frankia sp. Hr75.2]
MKHRWDDYALHQALPEGRYLAPAARSGSSWWRRPCQPGVKWQTACNYRRLRARDYVETRDQIGLRSLPGSP